MPGKILLPFVILIIAIAGFIAMVVSSLRQGPNLVSPLAQTESLPQRIIGILGFKNPLDKTVETGLKGFPGQYGVAIKNLKTGQEHYTNKNQQFAAASLYKLWVMAAAFEEIKKGTLKEDEVLEMPASALDEIQEILPTDRGTVSMPVGEAIERMITVSDNDAGVLLYTRLGNDEITGFLAKNGFNDSTFTSSPQTSAKDVANFYEKLYRGAVVDPQYSAKMLSLLLRQRINDKLPQYLPKGTKIAHKTGELDTFEHDAGIVYSPGGDYIIVVLTDTPDPQLGSETVAGLSKTVFDFFTQKPL